MNEQPSNADAVNAAVAGELRLLDPEVRSSAELMSELLDPDFREIGASGRWWIRSDIIAALVDESRPSDRRIAVSDMQATLLAADIVQLTYTSENCGQRAHRSSVWRRSELGWRLYFHQGTPTSR
ncbi:DUF4440 domain-containing protein [Nocardia sp. NPDC050799]|uniref:nuclear transport factor 2 family protein n=1 Tax=Nocardia sp. NPDC050799 TaxID=3154842 RepID=UPI0033FDC1EC